MLCLAPTISGALSYWAGTIEGELHVVDLCLGYMGSNSELGSILSLTTSLEGLARLSCPTVLTIGKGYTNATIFQYGS